MSSCFPLLPPFGASGMMAQPIYLHHLHFTPTPPNSYRGTMRTTPVKIQYLDMHNVLRNLLCRHDPYQNKDQSSSGAAARSTPSHSTADRTEDIHVRSLSSVWVYVCVMLWCEFPASTLEEVQDAMPVCGSGHALSTHLTSCIVLWRNGGR